ncbi:MAG: hypothetical protein JRF54_10625, partial [Deltaproteobacteria bacterium]|nr:hypothetical protein [Deltaproteobacteria bacterium]
MADSWPVLCGVPKHLSSPKLPLALLLLHNWTGMGGKLMLAVVPLLWAALGGVAHAATGSAPHDSGDDL